MSVFLSIADKDILFKATNFFIIKDYFPVSDGHCLIVSNKVRKDYFDLTGQEKEELFKLIDITKNLIEEEYRPDGYNIGMNCGEAAGQTIMHFHCHVIPRYKGDMGDPRGGIRHCVEGKGYY